MEFRFSKSIVLLVSNKTLLLLNLNSHYFISRYMQFMYTLAKIGTHYLTLLNVLLKLIFYFKNLFQHKS